MVLLSAALPLRAQGASRWSLDLMAGQATATGRDWYERESGAADIILTRHQRTTHPVRLLASGHLGMTFKNGTSTTCPIAISGQCAPRLPTFRMVGTLVGVAYERPRVSTALQVGPAYFVGSDFDHRIISKVGAAVHADVAGSLTEHVGLVAAVRYAGVTSRPGVQLRTVVLGLRFR
jgi:hypothetical protein